MDPALQELAAGGRPDEEVAVLVRLKDPSQPPPGLRLVAEFGSVATCRIRRGDIVAAHASDPVVSMKAARFYGPSDADDIEAEPDVESSLVGEAPADAEPADADVRRPAGTDWPGGADVAVAHIDWGIDVASPAFLRPDGRTRIAAFWDQRGGVDPARPNRYGYGRIFWRADIEAALASGDPYAALDYHPADFDTGRGTHGTHTTSISAGSAAPTLPSGIAPESDIVFVHLSTYTPEGPTDLGDSVAYCEAIDFVLRATGSRPPDASAPSRTYRGVVINSSLGRHGGPHVGLTLVEQALDAALREAPGRAFVHSAGNYFDRRAHASGTLRPGETHRLRFVVGPRGSGERTTTPTEVELWYPGTDRLAISIASPDGSSFGPLAGDAHLSVEARYGEAEPVEVGRLYHRLKDPNNGDNEAVLFLDRGAPAGTYELALFAGDVADGRYHVWIERNNAGKREQAEFESRDFDPKTTTGTICNGFRTIAVGAYDAHAWLAEGDVPETGRPLAAFSSSGPTRDGRQKPDLCAPGMRVLAARSRPRQWPRMGDGAPPPVTTRMSGTSMAAPHVTGTIALMFAVARRPLAIEETRRLLLASTDPLPTDAPASARRRVGSGFLNTTAAIEAARAFADAPSPQTRSVPAIAAAAPHATARASEVVPEVEAMNPSESLIAAEAMAASEDTGYYPEYYPDYYVPEASPSEGQDEGESSRDRVYAVERGTMRRDWGAPPISFVIPLGGGGITPAVSVPLGGGASPISLAVPLIATPSPAPAATAAPILMPAATGLMPTAEPAVTVADGKLWEPTGEAVMAAGGPKDTDEGFGPRVVAVAESVAADSGAAGLGSAGALDAILSAIGRATGLSPLGDDGHRPTATELFKAFVGGPMAGRALTEHYSSTFECLARPGETLSTTGIRAGDLLVRIAPGESWGTIAVVGGAGSEPSPGGIAAATSTGSGTYMPVVELGAAAPTSVGPMRRVADSHGAVLPDTMLLRIRSEGEAAPTRGREAAPAKSDQGPAALAKGASGDAVKALQRQLNGVSAAEVKAGRLALEGCPLPVDGRFEEATENALRDFQMRTFSDDASQWDGVLGPATRAKLEAAATATPSGSDTAAPAASPRSSSLFNFDLFGRGRSSTPSPGEAFAAEVNDLTPDLSDVFFAGMHAVASAIGTNPEFLLAVMNSESGIRASAHNPNGHASGLIQFMPTTLRRLGWTAGHEAFRQLSAEQQLPFVQRYYQPFAAAGLNSTARLYQATFLPATLSRGSSPDTVIVDVNNNDNAFAYGPNRGFDRRGDGRILVGDLTAFVERAKGSARWREARDRLAAVAPGPLPPLPVPPQPVPPLPINPPGPGPIPVPPATSHPTLRRGARGDAVREAQTKLNAVHASAVGRGQPGLADSPLKVDGIFGQHTYNAVVSFQQQVFPIAPHEWDGVIGPKTWAQLDAAASALPPIEALAFADDAGFSIGEVDEATQEAVGEDFGEQAAQVNWCQMRTAIANAARTELARWTRPNGTSIPESDPAMLPVLTQYWQAVPGFGAHADALAAAQQSAADHPDFPWSAAFICFVMRAAGVQAAHGFAFSGRHVGFIVGALRNREQSDRNRPFWLTDQIEIEAESTPEPGDLVCFNRCAPRPGAPASADCHAGQAMTQHSYSSLRREFWVAHPNANPTGSSHTALVVGTTTRGGRRFLETIGGNESNSVRLRSNVELNAAGGIANPADHHVFGLIKIVAC